MTDITPSKQGGVGKASPYDPATLGKSVQAARVAVELSQEELAKLAGMSLSTLSKIERGAIAPSIFTVKKIADTLHLTLDELLGTPPLKQARRFGDFRSAPIKSKPFVSVINSSLAVSGKESNMDNTQKEDRPLTFGEKAVGLSFNPSNDDNVYELKLAIAAFIDRCNDIRTGNPGDEHDPDVARMMSVAITEAQTAQMWAVKAVTWSN